MVNWRSRVILWFYGQSHQLDQSDRVAPPPDLGAALEPDRLKSIPLFQTVSDEDLSQIAPFADEARVNAGTRLVREGDF